MNATATTSVSELAREAHGYFERREREGSDDSYVTLKDDRPEWVYDLVYEAHGHGDYLPDDYRYAWTREALGDIADSGAEDVDDLDDLRHQFADAVDVYTGALLKWAGSNLRRLGYCDQAQEDGLAGEGADVARLLTVGQYEERGEVFSTVVGSLRERLETAEHAEAIEQDDRERDADERADSYYNAGE